MRGGARPGAGRPRIYEDGVRRSVTMTRWHWDAVELMARLAGTTPSSLLSFLVEDFVNEVERVEAIDDDAPAPPSTRPWD